jgi:hypothetical protein
MSTDPVTFPSDVIAALETRDIGAMDIAITVAEGRKAGTKLFGPALRALKMYGVDKLCSAWPCNDPQTHEALKTVELAGFITHLVKLATDQGMIEDEIFDVLKADKCVRVRGGGEGMSPVACPHIPCGGGDWLFCGSLNDGGCRGYSCDLCGAPRPPPWRSCNQRSRCRDFLEPELTQVCFLPPLPSLLCCVFHADSAPPSGSSLWLTRAAPRASGTVPARWRPAWR